MKPEFVDNREITLVEALKGHLEWLHTTYARPVELAIASGYFNPEGFALIAEQVERLPKVRLLIGAEPVPPPSLPDRIPGSPRGDRLEAQMVKGALEAHERGLQKDRDRLAFNPSTDRALRRLLTFLDTGRMEVRRYEKRFLHGKAFIFSSDEGVISGSSNFTAAGLTSNVELNLGRYEPGPVTRVKAWFDALWSEAVPYDLAAVYAARFQEYSPYLVYLRVLWERYKDEITEESGTTTRIRLTTFQNDGIFRAKRIAENYHGVLIADGVGLGKTFVAGELLRQAVEDRRQRAVLIAPATLRDGTWARFIDTHQLYLETISYEELANDVQLGGERPYLKQRQNDYALVVIDEAQAFRNPDTQRARALRRLLQGKPPKTLVLLSATPVNNSLWDLYYLLTYFVGHDAAFADKSIRSLKERFADAVAQDPDDLRPDALFEILDEVTVRRTRHFVKRYYPNDRVLGPGGVEMPVHFPDPHVESVTYSLDDVLPGFFDSFAEALAPEAGEPELTLARYSPTRYRPGTPSDPREAALVGLLRSALLKRFESSVYAFARTADRMADAHDTFLKGLDQGFILTSEVIEEWEPTDSDEAFDALLRGSGMAVTKGYDLKRLRADVTRDRNLLRGFAAEAMKVSRERDPKLKRLVEEIHKVLTQATRDALGPDDLRDKRKLIVFSHFADTVGWVRAHLEDVLASDRRLASYRGRLVSVTGDESAEGVSRAAAVFGFAPRSSEAPAGRDQDLFDIMVTTDVLAEGMNLQQARNIINYDLPWNPMRLVQRHGRIDRIGSPHLDVYIRCFFPDRRLDALLTLEERIRRKLAQAAASVGVEHEVIPGGATSDRVFTETREEIEALRREDPTIFENGGEDPSAHSGEEYRQELRKGIEQYGDRIKSLPWGTGSGFRGGPAKGHFFCARIGDRVFLRFVPWADGKTIRDTLGCLRLITCREDSPRQLPPELVDCAYTAWEKAQKDIYDEWMFATDPANLQPKVRPALKAAADHLRKHPPAGIVQEDLDRLIEAIEAPWGIRIEKQIREALESGTETATSAELAKKVKELGLEPFKPPEPLPPILMEDVALICWMAVEPAPASGAKL